MSERGIKALIRLHRFQLDELRRSLGNIERQRDELMARDRVLQERLQDERELVRSGFGRNSDYQGFAQGVEVQRQKLTHAVHRIDEEIERLRDEMAGAFQDVKKFEITAEERERQAQKEVGRKEQLRLDEIGVNNHRRSQLQR